MSGGGGITGVAYPVNVEWEEHSAGIEVNCSDDLTRLLSRIETECDPDRPLLVMIENEGGTLSIGIGAAVSTLNHVPPKGDPPYMIYLGDSAAEGVIDFYDLGQHSQFLARNTIPNEVAQVAALEFAMSGRLPDSIVWEAV